MGNPGLISYASVPIEQPIIICHIRNKGKVHRFYGNGIEAPPSAFFLTNRVPGKKALYNELRVFTKIYTLCCGIHTLKKLKITNDIVDKMRVITRCVGSPSCKTLTTYIYIHIKGTRYYCTFRRQVANRFDINILMQNRCFLSPQKKCVKFRITKPILSIVCIYNAFLMAEFPNGLDNV